MATTTHTRSWLRDTVPTAHWLLALLFGLLTFATMALADAKTHSTTTATAVPTRLAVSIER